jgi:hypothetical protein
MLHSVFRLSLSSMPELSADVAVKLLSQLFDIKLLIIDEISYMLYAINNF